MQTDTVAACYIENNDHIVIDGEVKGYVYMVDEEGDYVHLDVVDDEGEHTIYAFAPFDPVAYVTVFEDEFEYEDVEV